MILMKIFRAAGKQYVMMHDAENDSRVVFDDDDDTVLIIDSDLRVTARDGKVGDLENEGGEWVFYYGPLRTRFCTGVSSTDHCWRNLLHAEVAAATHYLERTTLPKFKRAECTEGGSCD